MTFSMIGWGGHQEDFPWHDPPGMMFQCAGYAWASHVLVMLGIFTIYPKIWPTSW